MIKLRSSQRAFVLTTPIAVLLASNLLGSDALATDGTWTSNASASWSDTTRWTSGIIADGQDSIADFSTIAINGNRTVTLDSARTVGVLKATDLDAATAANNSWTISGSNTLTLSTTTGTPTITVAVGIPNVTSAAQTFLQTSVPLGGTQGLIKNGPGQLRVNGANTFTGPVLINEGQYRILAGATSAPFGLGTDAVTVANGAQLYINAGTISNNAITISGLGVIEPDGINRLGAIRFAAAGTVVNTTITMLTDSRIGTRGATGAGATIGGQITGAFALELGHSTSKNNTNAGAVTLSNSANNWGGSTGILAGTVRVGAVGGVIPDGSTVTLGDTSDTSNCVLDLNGFDETINGLNSTGSAAADFVQNSGPAPGTLTIGSGNAGGVFAGTLKDNGGTLSLTKTGSGTQ